LGVYPEGGQTRSALLEQRIALDPLQLAEVMYQPLAQQLTYLRRIPVRATERLGQHLIDESECREPIGREVQLRGGLLLLVGVLPEDRGAALGRDDRVGRELQHQQPVAD